MSRVVASGRAVRTIAIVSLVIGVILGVMISYGAYRIHKKMQPTPGALPPPAFHFKPAAIVALGDSITFGINAPTGKDWPDAAHRLDPALSISNRGIPGNTVNWPGCSSCDLTLVQRFQRDVLAIPGAHTLVILEGVNDILQGGNANEIEQGLSKVTQEAHVHHLKVIGCTILPYGGSPGWSTKGEAIRTAVNRWILHSSGDDTVLDTAARMASPMGVMWLNPIYDSGDGIHPNAAGHEALAKMVVAALK